MEMLQQILAVAAAYVVGGIVGGIISVGAYVGLLRTQPLTATVEESTP